MQQVEISSPRTFPAFARTSKESIEIPHVIMRTAATTRRHASSVGTPSEERWRLALKHSTSDILAAAARNKLKPHLDISCQPEAGGWEALDELQLVAANL